MESSCVACDRPDEAENMVQCDACDTWWHFSCAKVTASVSNRSWICSKCTKDDSMSFKSGKSERSGSQLAESMARLKERQELERKRLELDLQKKFLDATVAEVSGSMRSCGSRRESIRRVEEWISHTAEPKTSEADVNKATMIASQLQLVQPAMQKRRTMNSNLLKRTQVKCTNCKNSLKSARRS